MFITVKSSIFSVSSNRHTMKILLLNSKTHGIQEVLYDEDDEKLILENHWYVTNSSNALYAITPGKMKRGVRLPNRSMHRLIMNVNDPKILIDHRNSNGLDNRKSNLRIATAAQNCRNARLCKRNRTGYKGVSVFKKKFRARIKCNGPELTIGFFKTAKEAAIAYNEYAVKLHGEFACLNVV